MSHRERRCRGERASHCLWAEIAKLVEFYAIFYPLKLNSKYVGMSLRQSIPLLPEAKVEPFTAEGQVSGERSEPAHLCITKPLQYKLELVSISSDQSIN